MQFLLPVRLGGRDGWPSGRPFLWCLALVLAGAAPARADLLLQVSGPNDLLHTINSDQAAGVTFTLANPAANVTITADLVCPFPCLGTVWLTTDIGPSSGFGDVVAAASFNGTSTTLFTGLNLAADTYFLIVASDASTPSSQILWRASSAPTVVQAPGVTHSIDLFASNAATLPPQSNFSAVFDRSAFFTVEAVTAAVPEPASVVLLAVGGLGLLSYVRRRQKARAA